MVMIANGHRVSMEYALTVDNGRVVSTNIGAEPFIYLHGGEQIPPALERQLEGLRVGDHREIALSPEEAYGPVDPAAFMSVEPGAVPEHGRKTGKLVEIVEPGTATRVARVHGVFPDHIVLDFNHPLAGERLTFNVHILGVELSVEEPRFE